MFIEKSMITRGAYLLFFTFALLSILESCHKHKIINTSFYYRKTIYKSDQMEAAVSANFTRKLYVRIMDVNMDDDGISPVPVSPITFKDKLQ